MCAPPSPSIHDQELAVDSVQDFSHLFAGILWDSEVVGYTPKVKLKWLETENPPFSSVDISTSTSFFMVWWMFHCHGQMLVFWGRKSPGWNPKGLELLNPKGLEWMTNRLEILRNRWMEKYNMDHFQGKKHGIFSLDLSRWFSFRHPNKSS